MTLPNPFTQLVTALAGSSPQWPPFPRIRARAQPPVSRTAQIRQLVRISGPLSAQAIAVQLELERTDLVSALVANDLKQGRMRRIGPLYEWNHAFDEELALELKAAARLLRRHGFTVRKAS